MAFYTIAELLGFTPAHTDDVSIQAAADILDLAITNVTALDAQIDAGRVEAQRLFAAGRAREQELWDRAYRGGVTQSWLDGE